MSKTDPTGDLRSRRGLLQTHPAPQPRHDAVAILETDITGAQLRLRYVPDRDVLMPDSFSRYVQALTEVPFTGLEEMAQTILEDINDQIIPCWLEITLRRSDPALRHEVRIEDRQPAWKDRGLLDRLAP